MSDGARAGSSDVTPSQRATGSIVVPWSRVESSTAKKTMLKNSSERGYAVEHRERREHHGHRAT